MEFNTGFNCVYVGKTRLTFAPVCIHDRNKINGRAYTMIPGDSRRPLTVIRRIVSSAVARYTRTAPELKTVRFDVLCRTRRCSVQTAVIPMDGYRFSYSFFATHKTDKTTVGGGIRRKPVRSGPVSKSTNRGRTIVIKPMLCTQHTVGNLRIDWTDGFTR